MSKLEYKTILLPYKTGTFQPDNVEIAEALNVEGAERWRLSQLVMPAAVWGRSNAMIAILERSRE
jgi:hypothetical protein